MEKVYRDKDLPHLNISQRNRVNIIKWCRHYGVEFKTIKTKNNTHGGQGYTRSTNLITHDIIDTLVEKVTEEDSVYTNLRLNVLKVAKGNLDGKFAFVKKTPNNQSESIKIGKSKPYFAILAKKNPSIYRFCRIVGKCELSIGYKKLIENFNNYVEYILDFGQNFETRGKYIQHLIKLNSELGSYNSIYNFLDNMENDMYDFNIRSFFKIRNFKRKMEKSIKQKVNNE